MGRAGVARRLPVHVALNPGRRRQGKRVPKKVAPEWKQDMYSHLASAPVSFVLEGVVGFNVTTAAEIRELRDQLHQVQQALDGNTLFYIFNQNTVTDLGLRRDGQRAPSAGSGLAVCSRGCCPHTWPALCRSRRCIRRSTASSSTISSRPKRESSALTKTWKRSQPYTLNPEH